MARRRPNAFEVSFGEEAPELSITALSQQQPVAVAASSSLKRKSEAHGPEDNHTNRRKLPPSAFYVDPDLPNIELETGNLIFDGEDPFLHEDGDGANDKPIRVLTGFAVYDPLHAGELMPLNAIEEDDGLDRQFEAAGYASPYVEIEEDEGQEDAGGEPAQPRYVRLSSILRYMFNFTTTNDPVWIETQFAWYILKDPSVMYEPLHAYFLRPRRVAQIVVSSALQNIQKTYKAFLDRFERTVDDFGRTYTEQHIWDAMSEIEDAVNDCDHKDKLKESSPILRHILQKATSSSSSRPALRRGTALRHGRKAPPIKALAGDLDLAVLKKENQSATHVTPRIAGLAQGLVREELVVVGERPPRVDKALKAAQKEAASHRLAKLVNKVNQAVGKVECHREHFVGAGKKYLRAVDIDGQRYEIGDFVLIPMSSTPSQSTGQIESSSTIADHFWFAKILYADVDLQNFHVQWLQHSSQTMMQELGNPQELFYNELCDHVSFKAVVDKIVVHEGPPENRKRPLAAHEYFVNFTYDLHKATYTSIEYMKRDIFDTHEPPYNCPVCPVQEQLQQDNVDYWLHDSQKIRNGVAYGGHRYHYEDFVLYRAKTGSANIGYIVGFEFLPHKGEIIRTQIYLKRVGRISSIPDLPSSEVRDERHVFLTDEKVKVPLQDLISVCHVFPFSSTFKYPAVPDLKIWLSLSPLHFYVRYKFTSMEVRSWTHRKPVSFDTFEVCDPCTRAKLDELKTLNEFFADAKRYPLRVLDLFGGVGAFSMGLAEGSGCLKLTDIVEISPSAAMTAKRNFPDVIVHNQCANEVLRYSIKEKMGQRPNPLTQLYDGKTILPSLKKPHVIVAGVPCQTHSTMNMYKKADDVKSNLILTALSYVDHLRPSLFYFENVPGFTRFTFNAVQSGIHKLEGGIEMGGLKFVVRALLDMRYQVRFGILQAGCYGAPQRRQRFFIIAAIDGHPLPEFPQPSHHFPDLSGLNLKLADGTTIRAFPASDGRAPHPSVSIDDAIGDLPRFDWKHPQAHYLSAEKQRELRRRKDEHGIKTFICDKSTTHCGFVGPQEYHHRTARTTYQEAARVKPTKNLQQFTSGFEPKMVERVVSIPLKPNADYRDLKPDQHEWQIANPLSAVARKNYRPGLYGRLDESQFFPTTVTNMGPTAKQSQVLNPYCHRIVTVRELARSQGFPDYFVFESILGKVNTMHRQIGNAVPLPIGIALGRELRNARIKRWLAGREDAIEVDDD